MSIMKKINKFFVMFFLGLFLNIIVSFDAFANEYDDLLKVIREAKNKSDFEWVKKASDHLAKNIALTDDNAKKLLKLNDLQLETLGKEFRTKLDNNLKSENFLIRFFERKDAALFERTDASNIILNYKQFMNEVNRSRMDEVNRRMDEVNRSRMDEVNRSRIMNDINSLRKTVNELKEDIRLSISTPENRFALYNIVNAKESELAQSEDDLKPKSVENIKQIIKKAGPLFPGNLENLTNEDIESIKKYSSNSKYKKGMKLFNQSLDSERENLYKKFEKKIQEGDPVSDAEFEKIKPRVNDSQFKILDDARKELKLKLKSQLDNLPTEYEYIMGKLENAKSANDFEWLNIAGKSGIKDDYAKKLKNLTATDVESLGRELSSVLNSNNFTEEESSDIKNKFYETIGNPDYTKIKEDIINLKNDEIQESAINDLREKISNNYFTSEQKKSLLDEIDKKQSSFYLSKLKNGFNKEKAGTINKLLKEYSRGGYEKSEEAVVRALKGLNDDDILQLNEHLNEIGVKEKISKEINKSKNLIITHNIEPGVHGYAKTINASGRTFTINPKFEFSLWPFFTDKTDHDILKLKKQHPNWKDLSNGKVQQESSASHFDSILSNDVQYDSHSMDMKSEDLNGSVKNYEADGSSTKLHSSVEFQNDKLPTSPEPSKKIDAADAKDLQNTEKGGRGMPCFMAGMMAVSIATRAASMATMNMSRKGALGNILKLLGSGRDNPPSPGTGSNGPNQGSVSNGPDQGSNNNGPDQGSNNNGPDQGSVSNGPNQGSVSNGPNHGSVSNGPNQGSNNNGPDQGSDNNGKGEGSSAIGNNLYTGGLRRLDADAEEMPSEVDLIPRLSPVAKAFMKSNGGLAEVLQMLPASPQELAEKLMKDGPKEYLTFLAPGMNDPVFEELLSKVETLDKSASASPLLSSRQSVSVESAPVERAVEPLLISSGWDSTAYLHRDVKNQDGIWHKNTEDNLFQIISKRLRISLR